MYLVPLVKSEPIVDEFSAKMKHDITILCYKESDHTFSFREQWFCLYADMIKTALIKIEQDFFERTLEDGIDKLIMCLLLVLIITLTGSILICKIEKETEKKIPISEYENLQPTVEYFFRELKLCFEEDMSIGDIKSALMVSLENNNRMQNRLTFNYSKQQRLLAAPTVRVDVTPGSETKEEEKMQEGTFTHR